MRVLLATDTFDPVVNGIAVFTKRLAAQLTKRGHEVCVVAPDWPGDDRSSVPTGHSEVRIPSIPVLIHQFTRICPQFRTGAARRLLERWRPDVVHLQTPWFVGQAVARASHELGLPLVATHHVRPENFEPYFPGWPRRLVGPVFWRQIRSVYRLSSAVAVPAETARQLLVRQTGASDISVISNGVDLDRFKPAWRYEDSCEDLGQNDRQNSILYVGRLDPDKGVGLLTEVIADVLGRSAATATILGTGSELPALQKRMSELGLAGRVRLPGFVANDDLPGWYRAASVLLMTGEGETQPIAALEAMASGLPVVGISSPGLDDVVLQDVTGLLVPTGSRSLLAAAVLGVLNSPKLQTELGRGARRTAERLHALEQTAEQYLRLYELTSGCRPPQIDGPAVAVPLAQGVLSESRP